MTKQVTIDRIVDSEVLVRTRVSFPQKHSTSSILIVAACVLFLLGSATARADVILSGQPVTAAAGSSGNSLDIELTNSGPSAITVGGFSFGISVANPAINFTDANTSTTDPYIFAGDSLFGPDLTGPTRGQSLTAVDVFDIPLSGVTVGAGTTVGLGHVLFDVAGTATAGAFPVSFASFPTSGLSDAIANNISIDTFSKGQITITATAVPEPSSLLPLLVGIVLVMGASANRRKNRSTQSH